MRETQIPFQGHKSDRIKLKLQLLSSNSCVHFPTTVFNFILGKNDLIIYELTRFKCKETKYFLRTCNRISSILWPQSLMGRP